MNESDVKKTFKQGSLFRSIMKYIYITEKKGEEGSLALLAYSCSSVPFSCLPIFLFPSSLPLSLAVKMENSVLDSGVVSESRPVVLALIDLSPFPLLSTSVSSFPCFILVPSLSPGPQMRKVRAFLFCPMQAFSSLFLNCSMTLAGIVAVSVFVHSSCIMKVDSLLLNVTQKNQVRNVVNLHSHIGLISSNSSLNHKPQKCPFEQTKTGKKRFLQLSFDLCYPIDPIPCIHCKVESYLY